MEVLLTGGAGQIGLALRRHAPAGWRIAAPTSSELDIADVEAVRAAVGAKRWDAVINAAAYTAVDRAEDEPTAAFRVNADGPARLAEAAAAIGAPIVHLSTDYVFDGAKSAPYDEDDPVKPLGVYGASKAAGEQAVRDVARRHAILRTAWVVSPDRSNFLKTMFRLADEGRALRVVSDQVGNPTSADDIARALVAVADRLSAGGDDAAGTYHFVNHGAASWFELARFAFEARARQGPAAPQIQAIPAADYGARARRPANSQLSTAKFERTFGITPRHWRTAITEVVAALAERRAG